MKNKSINMALEGTCSGDVAGGLLLWAGENLQALRILRVEAMRGRISRDLSLGHTTLYNINKVE
jgi:hypothetical protein